jgi:hypothetical protein
VIVKCAENSSKRVNGSHAIQGFKEQKNWQDRAERFSSFEQCQLSWTQIKLSAFNILSGLPPKMGALRKGGAGGRAFVGPAFPR